MTATRDGDPAVEILRGAVAAMDRDAAAPAVLAVAGDALGLLRAWRITAGLHASVAALPDPQDKPEAHSGPQSRFPALTLTGGGRRVQSQRTASQDILSAVETTHRQVPAQSNSPAVPGLPQFGDIHVPHPLDPTEPAALPRRFASLWRDADGELSLAEAVTIAAVQMGHYETDRSER